MVCPLCKKFGRNSFLIGIVLEGDEHARALYFCPKCDYVAKRIAKKQETTFAGPQVDGRIPDPPKPKSI